MNCSYHIIMFNFIYDYMRDCFFKLSNDSIEKVMG